MLTHLKSPLSFILAVTALAAGLRLVHFTRVDLWQDEANEVFLCEGSWAETLARVRASEMRPPLRYLFLKVWLLGGRNTHYLRVPSLLFSVAAVGLLYLVARRGLAEGTALIGALIMAAASFPVSTAHFCRSYSMDLLVTLLAVHAYFCWEDRQSLRHRVYAIAAVTAALYTTYFFDFVFAVMLVLQFRAVHRDRSGWRGPLLLFTPILLLTSPLLFLAPEQWSNARANQWHAGGADLTQLLAYFRVLGSGRIKNWDFTQSQDFASLLCAFLSIVGIWRIVKRNDDRDAPTAGPPFFVWWFAGPVAVIFLFSLASIGLFTIRTMVVFAPAYYALVAAGIRSVQSRAGRALAVAILLASNVYSFATTADLRYLTNGSRLAAEMVGREGRAGEWVIHASHFTYFPMRFYAPQLEHRIYQEQVPWNWGAAQVPPEHLLSGLKKVRGLQGFWFIRKINHYQESPAHWWRQLQELTSSWHPAGSAGPRTFSADRRARAGSLVLTHYTVTGVGEPQATDRKRIQQELQALQRLCPFEDEWIQHALGETAKQSGN